MYSLPKKTEIARSASEPRSQELFAEGEMANQYLGQKKTADHKVLNEGGESRNNHRCPVVVQDFNHSMDSILSVRNKNFTGDGKEFTKVSLAVGKAESHLH